MIMREIRNKIALVTGGASGIGRAIALQLAREGADLYLVDIDEAALAETVAAVGREGVQALGRRCDVSQPDQITECVEYVLERWGGVDILVNNAGITYYGSTAGMTAEHCERLLAINLHAPIHFTRELLPTLLERDEAHVLNVASFFGLIGTQKLAVYTCSKFGIVGFSESLRAEYGRRGLGVTALCPGFVDTDLFATAPRGSDLSENRLPPDWMLTTPDKIAARAIRAIYRNHAMVVQPAYAKVASFGKRFFPGLIDWANHLSCSSRKQKPEAEPAPDSTRRRAA
ncbi:MAG: SDR family NAD(P)-dependent oxidoreductase [Planctomycetes bacterium]|nr:SDR family NAD(P)-dependent oxidoreductase [Planctomycetota bacterium]